MALANDRKTKTRLGVAFSYPVAEDAVIYQGAMVALNAGGYLVPVTAVATLRVVGKAKEYQDNTDGDNGAIRCEVEPGIFLWDNSSAGDEITLANGVGNPCYGVDDETVALTEGAGRSVAGIVVDVDDAGVWVASGSVEGGPAIALAGGATNLIHFRIEDAVSANALVHRYVHRGPAATISSISTTIDRALTGGNMTLTAAINGVAVTTGAVTITQAGSAAGDIDTVLPTALNDLVEGDVVTFTVGGTQTSVDARVDVTMEITY
jgi:hypothetical protein